MSKSIDDIRKIILHEITKSLEINLAKACTPQEAYEGMKIGNLVVEKVEYDGQQIIFTLGLPEMTRIEIKGEIK